MGFLRNLAAHLRRQHPVSARSVVAAQRRYGMARAALHPAEPLSNVRRMP
ncbi:MAG TPA: hypothetical protein VF288_04500 [Mycobacteriales bacterium]